MTADTKRFHVGKDGVERKCRAQTEESCPVTAKQVPELQRHFDTPEQAREFYQSYMDGKEAEKDPSKMRKPVRTAVTLEEMAVEQEEILQNALRTRTPISGEDLERRKVYVEKVISALQNSGWSSENKYATLSDYTGSYHYSAERVRQQEEIIDDIIARAEAGGVKRNGQALFSGGMCGAGKTTILTNNVKIDMQDYLVINADEIKEMMAERGMIPKVKGLTPMEASALSHVESGEIAETLFFKAASKRMNMILDMTMANTGSITERTYEMKDQGYTAIQAIFVDVKPETSLARADSRYVEGMNEYTTSGGKTQGGRFMPPSVINSSRYHGSEYNSTNARNLVSLHKWGEFTHEPAVFNNDGPEAKRVSYASFSGKKS